MANTGIYMSLGGHKQAIASLQGVSTRGKNLTPWLTKVSSMFISTIKDNFRSNGAKLDKPWAARKRSYTWPILNKTGKMKGSFTSKVSSKKSVIGNADQKFPWHQEGTRRGIPPRPMLGVAQSDAAEAAHMLANYLLKGRL